MGTVDLVEIAWRDGPWIPSILGVRRYRVLEYSWEEILGTCGDEDATLAWKGGGGMMHVQYKTIVHEMVAL